MKNLKMIFVGLVLVGALSSCGNLILTEEEVFCDATSDCEVSSSSQLYLSSLGESSAEGYSEVVLSSESEEKSSVIELSSEKLVSSSMVVSSSSRFVAVSSVMSSFNEVWDGGSYKYISVEMLDEWGLVGEDKGGIVFPWSDVVEGGNSQVLDQDGNSIGFCPLEDSSCQENWDISGTFDNYTVFTGYVGEDAFRDIGLISSYLQVTDYVPSSKTSWGWGESGWWILPSYDKDFKGDSPFEKVMPIGLKSDSWVHIALNYPKGEGMIIELAGLDINKNDENQSPPRFHYDGKGYGETLSIPLRAIKRAGWSIPYDYDPTLVTGIGLFRMEASMSEGAEFPQGISKKNKLQFACISFSYLKYDGCGWSHGY